MSKFLEYISETKTELKNVSWPTKKQTITFTTIVIVVSIIVATYVGFFDWLLSIGLQQII